MSQRKRSNIEDNVKSKKTKTQYTFNRNTLSPQSQLRLKARGRNEGMTDQVTGLPSTDNEAIFSFKSGIRVSK